MSRLTELLKKSNSTPGRHALPQLKYLYALILFVAMTLFVAAFPFQGNKRFLHAPHAIEINELVTWQPSETLTYTLANNSPAPDYAGFRSEWHPQKDVRRISLLFKSQQGCLQELRDSQNKLFATLNRCEVISTEILQKADFKPEKDLLQAEYNLNEPLPSGNTLIKVQTQDPIPAQIDQPESKELTLLAFLNQGPKFGDLFRQLLGRGKFNALFFILALGLLSFGWVLAKRHPRLSLLLVISAFCCSFLALVPNFSGNDETAHFSMLLQGANERSIAPEAGSARISRINSSARDLMFLDDFFKLHSVYPPPQGACLHQIIGDCGITEKPKNFYKKYLAWLDLDRIEFLGAGKVLTLVRLQNFFLFFILIFATVWLFNQNFEFIAPLFILFASAFSTLTSLSNDVFGVFIGIFLTAYQFWLLKNQGKLKVRSFATLLAFFLFYLGTKVDSNAFAALPVLAASSFFLITSAVRPPPILNEKRGKTLTLIFLLLSSVALFTFIRHFVFQHASTLLLPYFRFLEDSRVIQFLGTVPLATSLSFILTFLQGILGQFIWSHTSYPTLLSFLLMTFIFLFTAFSLSRNYLTKDTANEGFRIDYRVISCLFLQAVLFALLLDSVGSYGNTTAPGAWSFLVTRFFYPGIAVVFVPILLAIDSCPSQKKSQVLKVFRYTSLTWATLNLLYFHPRFFLADAW